jgi:O-methyltransferase involved in polyketide biosynthesis
MNRTYLTRIELASALARGVRQLVFIGAQETTTEALRDASGGSLRLFAVDEQEPIAPIMTFVPTRFESEELSAALSRSNFDRLKTSLFIWFGDATYRTMDAALSTLSFIASLPEGSGVIFDYAAERSSLGSFAGTALDALASRISCAGGAVKHLIQPQAVAAMLRGLGFGHMTDHTDDELSPLDGHIVSALV